MSAEGKKKHNFKKLQLKPLSEQVIVITGASSGIGLVTARMAAERGAKVVVAARNKEALDQLVDELEEKGHKAVAVQADVGEEKDVDHIARTAIETFGGFDTWVNNAGVTIYSQFMETSIEDMRRIFETNYWGAVYGSRAAIKHYKEKQSPGALINTGSLFGGRADEVQSVYSSSKHALHGLTEAVRMELEKEGAPVSVTLVHPGRIDTPYNEHAKSYFDKQPAHRGMLYPPEAVAEAILLAAEKPKRDLFVGSQAKFVEFVGQRFPRFTDRLMEVAMYPTEHKDEPSKPKEDNALYEAGYGLHERGTNVGWNRSGSWFVKAAKHPVITAAAAAGAGLLLVAGWQWKQKGKKLF